MSDVKTGTVYLVGAGPGDPELLTIRAARLIEAADAIVFDRLVDDRVLARAPAVTERYDAGKSSGRQALPQQEINRLLVRLARQGKAVVRLKGGDPFMFGRGAEEAEFLAAEGIPYQVVPGLSSATAAPAAAGIPLTRRGVASSVAIVTGHGSAGAAEPDWEAVVRLDTVVFLMGVSNLGSIADRLVRAGRDGSTPAAVVERAFWPEERTIVGTLGSIEQAARAVGIQPPATLVVGPVAALAARLRLRRGVSY